MPDVRSLLSSKGKDVAPSLLRGLSESAAHPAEGTPRSSTINGLVLLALLPPLLEEAQARPEELGAALADALLPLARALPPGPEGRYRLLPLLPLLAATPAGVPGASGPSPGGARAGAGAETEKGAGNGAGVVVPCGAWRMRYVLAGKLLELVACMREGFAAAGVDGWDDGRLEDTAAAAGVGVGGEEGDGRQEGSSAETGGGRAHAEEAAVGAIAACAWQLQSDPVSCVRLEARRQITLMTRHRPI